MGLFKNKSKPDKEALNKMWQEAYRANPRVYENPQDQSILAGFALTEDTPSLFPLVPENQWAIEGKAINSWMITMVSLTKPQGALSGRWNITRLWRGLDLISSPPLITGRL